MAETEKQADIATGRRSLDGHVRLYVFGGDMLALSIEEHAERSPTLLLTREQALQVQSALAELIPSLGEEPEKEATDHRPWNGQNRRNTPE